MASQESSAVSWPGCAGRRMSHTFLCGASPGAPVVRPHHQRPRRTLPQSAMTRSSIGVLKPTTDWYRGWIMNPGFSDCSARLSCSPACFPMYCSMWLMRYEIVWSLSSGRTCDSTRTPAPLLRWVGFTTTSGQPSSDRCVSTKCATWSHEALPSMESSAGSWGTFRLSSILCSIILSASAWIVRLPALSRFITDMMPGRSSCLSPSVAAEMSKSSFSSKSRAARSHGRMSVRATGSSTPAGSSGASTGGAAW
mmetsp:Transcript_39948/g.103401  ORF Transcript_39948/g.103401 Transcript_39948/m.103401 type:complete len:252 (+) Transcript_39948:143-898(+)